MNAHAMLLGSNEDEIALPDMDDRLNHRGDEGSEEDTLESFADIDYDVFAQEHNGLKEKERTMQDNSPDLT